MQNDLLAISAFYKTRIKVRKSDSFIERVFARAEYCGEFNEYLMCFIPANYTVNEIEEGHLYSHYIIGGKLYDTSLTLNYKKLQEIFKKENKNEQLSLF